MNKNDLFEEFNVALEQEIDFIKEKGGDSKFILRNGELVDNHKGRFIYEFITDVPIELDDDTPINIRYGNESVSGSIITVNGLKVLLGLNQNIGSKIPEIIITASTYFLLEILKDRFEEVKSKKFPFNLDIAMKTFGFKGSSVDEDYKFLTPFNELKLPISGEQKDALAKSLGSEVTFIWGPPGTGKTTTLSYLANELLVRDKSILLVSHTNVAIDNALERIAKILEQKKDEKYYDGLILRIGNSQDKDFFDKEFPKLSLDYWVEEKSKKLRKDLNKFEDRLNKEMRLLDKFNEILRLFRNIEKSERKIEKLKSGIEKTKTDFSEVKKRIKDIRNKIIDTKNKLKQAENVNNFISRLLTGLNPKKLERLLNEFSLSLNEEEAKLSQLHQQINIQEDELQTTKGNYTSYKGRLSKLIGEGDLDKNKLLGEIDKQKNIIKELSQQVEKIKEAIRRIAYDIVINARLIGTTITKGYLNQEIYRRNFDAVIVDEASMAPLPALFFDCGLATSKTIIIGDFRQLSPIAMAEDGLVKKWLRRDIFEVSGIIEKVNGDKEDERMVTLTEQRRMPEDIAELVNGPIYKGQLVTRDKPTKEDNQEKAVINSEPFPRRKIVLCDTSEFNPWCTKSPVRRSPFNVYNAFLSVYLAERALLDGVNNITILTPYKAQNSLIHKLVADKTDDKTLIGKRFKNVIPASVHKFQGRENELIIFDLVEGPLRKIRWLGGGLGTEAMRLINVAITRARAKIIFVANLKYLKNKLSPESILKQILRRAEEICPVINTQEFFPFIKIPIQRVESIKLDNSIPQFCNQEFFYKAFQNDLLQAKDEVVIVSPFVSRNRITTFEPIFRELHQKKIKTFVITKPLREQKISDDFGREIVNSLEKLNVKVISKKLSHEKLAVIDGNIVWHGSLNILSHRNTTELMVRFTTKEKKFSEEALKLCGINIPKIIEQRIIDKKIRELNKRGVGFCPNGHPFVIKRGSYGLFLSCSEFPRCRETMQLGRDIIAKIFGERYLYCEKCNSSMEIKFNPRRKSRFLGCSKYPNCRFTRPL